MGTTNGKVPWRVKYTFAFGALGKDLIYGMMANIRYDLLYGCVKSITGVCRNRVFAANFGMHLTIYLWEWS